MVNATLPYVGATSGGLGGFDGAGGGGIPSSSAFTLRGDCAVGCWLLVLLRIDMHAMTLFSFAATRNCGKFCSPRVHVRVNHIREKILVSKDDTFIFQCLRP